MLPVMVAVFVVLAAGSVFLLAYNSAERLARPRESRWQAFRNGLRRRKHRPRPVEVSLVEMLRLNEPDDVTPFAAFDQVRQRAVEQAARAAGLAAALVAREPSLSGSDQASEPGQAPRDPFADLSFSELEIARAELTLAELTLAKLTLAEPDLPPLAADEAATDEPDSPADAPDASTRTAPSRRARARTA